jgi:thiol-disulfide isomerase/thioredoxin
MRFERAFAAFLLPSFLALILVFPAAAAVPEDKHPGAAAPAKAATDTTEFDLTAFRGQVVYLDFWASWCAPCRKSFPWMRGMQERYAKRGFAVVAVNLDRDPKSAQGFLEKNAAPFRVIYDPKGTLAKAYKVAAMPSSYIYDRSGRQRASQQGFKDSDRNVLETQILDLLAESPPDSVSR